MQITHETLTSIKRHIFPPYCTSLDMAEILIKNFLKKEAFNISQLSELTEEEGQSVLAFVQNVFSKDLRQQAIEEIIEDHEEAKKNE